MYQVCKINKRGEMKYYSNLSEKKASRLYAFFKVTGKITRCITVKTVMSFLLLLTIVSCNAKSQQIKDLETGYSCEEVGSKFYFFHKEKVLEYSHDSLGYFIYYDDFTGEDCGEEYLILECDSADFFELLSSGLDPNYSNDRDYRIEERKTLVTGGINTRYYLVKSVIQSEPIMFEFSCIDDIIFSPDDNQWYIEYDDGDAFDYDNLAYRTLRDKWYGDYIVINVDENLFSTFYKDYKKYINDTTVNRYSISEKYAIIEYYITEIHDYIFELVEVEGEWYDNVKIKKS
jgi:hypothetical protein